jgi:uncharacterized repeat protein (TIGR01451 family)
VVFNGGRLAVPGKGRLGMAVFALFVALFVFGLTSDPAWAQTLTVTKTDTPDPVAEGETLTYQIVVSNPNDAGDATATGVVLTDDLPDDTTLVSVTSPTGTACTPTATGTPGTTDIVCTLGNIADGGSVTVTIEVQPTDDAVGTVITNEAEADCPAATPCTGATATADTAVVPDLEITKNDNPDVVEVNGFFTYTLTVENKGDVEATNVRVRDVLPGEVDFEDVFTSEGDCPQEGDTVRCDLGNLAGGDIETVTILVQANEAGTITNTAEVSAEVDGDQVVVDESNQATTTVNDNNNNGNNNNGQYDDFFPFPPGVFDDFNPDDDLEDAENDLEGDETTDADDFEDAEATTGDDGDGGALAQSGDPDEFAPESSVPGDVVDEINTGGQPLPNTGGMPLLAILAPIGGFLLLCFAVFRRIRGNS